MIREATPEDELALRALQGLLSESSPALLSHALSGPPLVLVSGDEPVGYLLAILEAEAYLAELVVAPPYRREGRASALLSALIERARDAGCESVRLVVREDNEPARALYEGFGFDAVERLPDHYEEGAGLLMCRRL